MLIFAGTSLFNFRNRGQRTSSFTPPGFCYSFGSFSWSYSSTPLAPPPPIGCSATSSRCGRFRPHAVLLPRETLREGPACPTRLPGSSTSFADALLPSTSLRCGQVAQIGQAWDKRSTNSTRPGGRSFARWALLPGVVEKPSGRAARLLKRGASFCHWPCSPRQPAVVGDERRSGLLGADSQLVHGPPVILPDLGRPSGLVLAVVGLG